MVYRFDRFELDTDNFTLSDGAGSRHLEPKVFDLIRYLLAHAGQVISRDTLVSDVWKGRCISDSTLSGAIKAARKALDDDGVKQRLIRTVRGRGFQFVAEVEMVGDVASSETASQSSIPDVADDSLPGLLILPLDTFGDAAALESFANGLVENMTTVLTRIPLLRIAGRTLASAYAKQYAYDPAVTPRAEFDWLLEGSVQKIAGSLRVNLQLIDAREGFHVWARQFDHPDTPEAFDALLDDVLARLEPQLLRVIYDRVRRSDGKPGSRQLLLQAMGLLSLKGWHKGTFEESASLLRQAIGQEPELALARAYLALVLGLGHRFGLVEKSETVARQAEQEAQAALDIDNMDSTVVGMAACALADIGQPERAIPMLQSAIELNRNNAQAWAALGSAQVLCRRYEEAIRNLRKGIDISPADSRRAVWCAVLAIAYLCTGQVAQAVETAGEACSYDHANHIPRVVLAGAWLASGEAEQAKSALAASHRVKPDLSKPEITGLLGYRLGSRLIKIAEG